MADLYDPLTYENLMAGVIVRFERQRAEPLASPTRVPGPGIYSLYYRGDLEVYAPISDGDRPIYVGKAVPPGSRKGDTVDEDHPALFSRLREHGRSIEQAANLRPEDFRCRRLGIVPVWITLAERFLITHYRPVWNLCLDGFGDHDPGKGRSGSERSWWDTLHPGRSWADKLPAAMTRAHAVQRVSEFLKPA